VIADPSNPTHVFAWKLARTEDPFGNRIEYEYERDTGEEGPHHWDQLDLAKIRYVDYGADPAHPRFLVTVAFVYEQRPATPTKMMRTRLIRLADRWHKPRSPARVAGGSLKYSPSRSATRTATQVALPFHPSGSW